MSAPRGLTNFIRDIRNCASKEDEKKRVNLELANIRTKFKQSDKLSSYDRKKCVRRAWGRCDVPGAVAPALAQCAWRRRASPGLRAGHTEAPSTYARKVCVEAAVHLHAGLRGGVRTHGGAHPGCCCPGRGCACALEGGATELTCSPRR